MTFAYQFDKADWMAFSLYHLEHSRLHQRQRRWARLGVSIGFLALGLLIFRTGERDLGLGISFAVIGVVLFLAYPKVYDDSIMKGTRRAVDDPDSAKRFGRQTMTLTAQGIHTACPGAESTITWANIVRLADTHDHMFIYVSAIEAMVIPRWSLEGASFEEVKEQLRRYIGRVSGDS